MVMSDDYLKKYVYGIPLVKELKVSVILVITCCEGSQIIILGFKQMFD